MSKGITKDIEISALNDIIMSIKCNDDLQDSFYDIRDAVEECFDGTDHVFGNDDYSSSGADGEPRMSFEANLVISEYLVSCIRFNFDEGNKVFFTSELVAMNDGDGIVSRDFNVVDERFVLPSSRNSITLSGLVEQAKIEAKSQWERFIVRTGIKPDDAKVIVENIWNGRPAINPIMDTCKSDCEMG